LEYRAVGKRCAVFMPSLNLPISSSEALSALLKKGFEVMEVNLINLARACVGTSVYRRGARYSDAPTIVDCSSLIKWLYGQRGVWLPRRSIQQRELGDGVSLDDITEGDVVFVSGWINYYLNDKADGVGHVGIYTAKGTVIHAADAESNVVESPLESFIKNNKLRGIRRYIQRDVLTLEIPEDRDIEIADDIRWIILQSLPCER